MVFDANRVDVPFAYCIVHVSFESPDLSRACPNAMQNACRKVWSLVPGIHYNSLGTPKTPYALTPNDRCWVLMFSKVVIKYSWA